MRDDTVGRSLFALGDGQWDIPELRRLLAEIIPRSAAVIGYEVSADFPVIGQRTMLVSARRLVHPDNNSTSVLIQFEDVSDRRRSEAENDILLAERRHRMKNLLAIVQALTLQTSVEGCSAAQYRDAFMGRFEAVIRAESLDLGASAVSDLSALIEQALGFAGPDRCRVATGPPVTLKKPQVMPISLILHELAANSAKFGALSTPDGVAHVGWTVESRDGANVLQMTWREEIGPHVPPPGPAGFGSRLIKFSAEQALGGKAEFLYEPTGLSFRLAAPLR